MRTFCNDKTVAPSKKKTDPDGGGLTRLSGVMVAVNVTDSPKTDVGIVRMGVDDDVTTVVVGS